MTYNILVTVCSYGRPDGLAALLRSLQYEITENDAVLVVDNNPAESGTLDRIRTEYPWAGYVHEERPGIPAARNRALAAADGYWAIIFVDDDETVSEGWLEAHRAYAKMSSADAFFGPVISVFEPGADPRIVAGGLLDRERHETGKSMPFGPTNNTLLKVETLRRTPAARFDERFARSGGSDVHFFDALRRSGAELEWNDLPLVYESVPAHRASVSWVRRRYQRMGHNMVSLNSRRTATMLTLQAMARVLLGAAAVPSERLAGRLTRSASGRMWIGLGMLFALSGRAHAEYVRDEELSRA